MALLVRGKLIEVPGITIISPASHGGPSWAFLDPADYRLRRTGEWVRQIIAHTTKGDPHLPHPKRGAGPGGRDRSVAEYWQRDPRHSAAQIVIDNDGSVVCLCDLAKIAAYDATVSNAWSVGVEMYQESDGGVYEAVYQAAVLLFPALCRIFGFAFQIPGLAYTGHPLRRMLNGGPDCVGIFGHRDNTEERGVGDPGDEIFRRLAGAGAERFDIDALGDLAAWKHRQEYLNEHEGENLEVDGIAGPQTMRALAHHGYQRGCEIL